MQLSKMKNSLSFSGIRIVFALLLTVFVFTQAVYAFDTYQHFYGLNQAEIKYYKDALKADPLWSSRANIFNGLDLDRLSWRDFADNRGMGIPEYDLVSWQATEVQIDRFDTRITLPEDLKFVAADGHVIGDEVCAGETIRLSRGEFRGEFYVDGGNYDTPPVGWVDDVRELAYNLVKTKVEKHQTAQATYPVVPLEILFGISGLFDSYGQPNSPTIIDSADQQANLRDRLKNAGYSNEADQLVGAEYSAPTYDRMDPTTLKYILITKNGSELGRILLKGALFGDYNDSQSYAVVSIGGRDLVSFTLSYDLNVYVPGGAGTKPIVDPLSGLTVYRVSSPTFSNVDAAVACAENGAMEVTGAQDLGGGKYLVTSKDSAGYSANYAVDCMYYFYGLEGSNAYTLIQMPAVRIYNGRVVDMPVDIPADYKPSGVDELFQVGGIYASKTWKVVSPANPKVELSIGGDGSVKFDETNNLRVILKNTGDADVSIASIHSNPEGKLVSCDSDIVTPGQQVECLYSVTPVQGQGLSIQVSYDYKSCGRSQIGLVTKTLMDSKVVKPLLKEQSYLMGVHGACDNSYYSCYSASEGNLFAGYKCYKTANGFFAPATERFNLRFDVSEVPKDVQIIGATLHLKASDIGKSQTVQVYSVDKIPEAVKCLPGGDICTQPYCGECKPLYDIDGTVASSTEISSTGQYSFNLTNQLKDKMAGDGIVSLQIRGAEGLWESQGQSSCSVENEWDKRDVSFDAGGRDGPYLEIVYR